MSLLTIYKASAGSGKTFTLAVEYIKFLIRNPWSYRNILAVTFTNKATDEMKTRILGQLYGISNSLPDSEAYLEKIVKETGMERDAVKKSASLALTLLIHNYDYFHVQTIDTFFQSVLRNLAKELDLSANLRIELNDKKIETQAVDTMIEELDGNSSLFSWLLRFTMENIDDNKGWDVVRAVRKFGLKIFDDEYKKESSILNSRLSEKGFYDKYTRQLYLMKAELKEALAKVRDDFFSLLADNDLDSSDIKGGKTIANYFNKLTGDNLSDKNCLNKTILECLEDSGKWVKKNDPRYDFLDRLVSEHLIVIMRKGEELRKKAKEIISSVDATLQNMKNLLLLNDIEKKVREMNSEANRFLLSDTQHLLHMMINDSDTPFIFEKIGTHLKYIMIDEFQDTSTVQWQNFLVLLHECMSHGAEYDVNNLIVGDIKQSIYRWRSGDWQILENIENTFGKAATDIRSLSSNYRSSRNIVAFNNLFFNIAARLEAEREKAVDPQLAEKIVNAYNDVEQEIMKQDSSGLVRIRLMPAGEQYSENTIKEIEKTIDELLSRGVRQNNIAILLRSNRNIPVIADYFNENRPDISLVSDEAFRLDHSVAINILIAALRLLYTPDDAVTKACLIKYYQHYILENRADDMGQLLDPHVSDRFLPEEFTGKVEELKKLPLYDLAERIFSIFSIGRLTGDSAYVCGFFDCLSAYIGDMSADVLGFLRDWDENIHSNKIQTDDVDGIQIMSIHASKGLEFDNVIVPFCDWRLEMFTDSYIWGHPTKEPYDELPIIPVRYSPGLSDSVYAADYRNEHMQITMDNLNLLYVAFTRAGKNLFVIGKRDASTTRSALIQNCIGELSEKLAEVTLRGIEDKKCDIEFEYGEFMKSKSATVSADDETFITESEPENVFLRKGGQKDVNIVSNEIPVVFRQSNKSKDFIKENSDESMEDDLQSRTSSYVKTGNVLHLVFSNIHTANDIDSVLDRFESEGILYGEDLDRKEIQRKLNECLTSNEMVADWFSGRWTLYNECSILSIDKITGALETRRPDRVMRDGDEIVVVDFKFGKMYDSYKKQVAEYLKLIGGMGYTDVKGYIWLVNRNKIIEVKIDNINGI